MICVEGALVAAFPFSLGGESWSSPVTGGAGAVTSSGCGSSRSVIGASGGPASPASGCGALSECGTAAAPPEENTSVCTFFFLAGGAACAAVFGRGGTVGGRVVAGSGVDGASGTGGAAAVF